MKRNTRERRVAPHSHLGLTGGTLYNDPTDGAQGALVRHAEHLPLTLLQPLQVAGLSVPGGLILKADVGRGGAPLRPLPAAGLPAGGVARVPILEVVSAGNGHPRVQGWAFPPISDGQAGGERS